MILVTGGAGYIGSHCVKELLAQGYEVVVLDDLSNGHRDAVLTEHFEQADLRDARAVSNILAKWPIRGVIHLAGLILVGESMELPHKYYDYNVSGTLTLLHAMTQHEIPILVYSSSAAVYGDPDVIPIPESHPKNPTNVYGKTKWMCEQMIEDFSRACGLNCRAMRYFNAAGCDPEGQLGERHHPETHLIPVILEVALGKRDQFCIFGTDYDTQDGTCLRDYVHVSDLAAAHVAALRHCETVGGFRAYNLGTGTGHTVREVLDECRRVTGREIRAAEEARRPGDPARLVADPAQAMKELGWRPSHTELPQIVSSAWNWMRHHS